VLGNVGNNKENDVSVLPHTALDYRRIFEAVVGQRYAAVPVYDKDERALYPKTVLYTFKDGSRILRGARRRIFLSEILASSSSAPQPIALSLIHYRSCWFPTVRRPGYNASSDQVGRYAGWLFKKIIEKWYIHQSSANSAFDGTATVVPVSQETSNRRRVCEKSIIM
jgi:hypothetical protein